MMMNVVDRYPFDIAAIDRMVAAGVAREDIARIVNLGLCLASAVSDTAIDAVSAYVGHDVDGFDRYTEMYGAPRHG